MQPYGKIKITQLKRNREIFLDIWYGYDKKSFIFYYGVFNKNGKLMIKHLFKEQPSIFQSIYELYLIKHQSTRRFEHPGLFTARDKLTS